MGQSLPSAHRPQPSAVQLEHVLELPDLERVRLPSAIRYAPISRRNHAGGTSEGIEISLMRHTRQITGS
jgi:hypothetical protein